ncbi:unnamed protein product [Schistosoma turkestanicum]|nr:unnamed protein product [Schistosoma turkestanicum]
MILNVFIQNFSHMVNLVDLPNIDFLSSLNITNRGDLTQKLHWAFKMYDLDNDGYISKQDLVEVLTAIYAMVGSAVEFHATDSTPEKRVEKIFQLMDLDRDDRLSLDEFINGVKCDKLLMRLLTLNTTTHSTGGGGGGHQHCDQTMNNGLGCCTPTTPTNTSTTHNPQSNDTNNDCTDTSMVINQSFSKQNIIADTSEI